MISRFFRFENEKKRRVNKCSLVPLYGATVMDCSRIMSVVKIMSFFKRTSTFLIQKKNKALFNSFNNTPTDFIN